jgi:hypothetical protein
MLTNTTLSNKQLLQEALTKIGRNLMLYQEMEIGLKNLIPVLHPDGGAKGIDSFKALKTSIELAPEFRIPR